MITKKWFSVIIFLAYFLITIIAVVLWQLKFQTSIIMSFLEITVPPSIPAFLAIFLSQYSAQAEDIRKGERLKDIQIKKEISESLKRHYKDVLNQVEDLRSKIEFPVRIYGENDIHIKELDTRYIKKPFPSDVDKAMSHIEGEFNTENPKFLENFINSEEGADLLNKEIDRLKEGVIEFLREKGKEAHISVADSLGKREEHKNEISGEKVLIFAYSIWRHKEQYSNKMQGMEKYFSDLNNLGKDGNQDINIPEINKKVPDNQSDINLSQNSKEMSVEWNHDGILAYIDSYISGIDVIGLILCLLKDPNLRGKCEEINRNKEKIEKFRTDFHNKGDKVISMINNNELLSVVDCCPFHEDKGDIYSYFKTTGLY